ncbi:MAG: sigma 54-interacting transcriptional regulator [Planctomycetes bacterium]|nr:sigma 54-interacting transcriptional regulator [Planctomycetota bacterium]
MSDEASNDDLRARASELLLEASRRGNEAVEAVLATLHAQLAQRGEAALWASTARASAAAAQALAAPLADSKTAVRTRVATPVGEFPGAYGILGGSPAMKKAFDLLAKILPTQLPVLVLGESGTGKELFAKALHFHGPRAKAPFLSENCAAIPENLLESELFGHVKGAFTGAVKDRPGHFRSADHGTLFLDEIGDMPLGMQTKLLRVLQEGEVRPVGGTRDTKVDVRVIAATHRELKRMVAEGRFREDLWFRLNVLSLPLPPLRERAGDVRLLADYFLRQAQRDAPQRELALDESALAALEAFPWPGNVRQLENELRRAFALSDGLVRRADLSPEIQRATTG